MGSPVYLASGPIVARGHSFPALESGDAGLRDLGGPLFLPELRQGGPAVRRQKRGPVAAKESDLISELVFKALRMRRKTGLTRQGNVVDARGGIRESRLRLRQQRQNQITVFRRLHPRAEQQSRMQQVAGRDEAINGERVAHRKHRLERADSEPVQLTRVVPSAVGAIGSPMLDNAARIRNELLKASLRKRLKQLFEVIRKPPIVVIQNREVFAAKAFESSPETGAAVAPWAIHHLEGTDSRELGAGHRRQIDLFMPDENHFKLPERLPRDRPHSPFHVLNRPRTTPKHDRDKRRVRLSGALQNARAIRKHHLVILHRVLDHDFSGKFCFENLSCAMRLLDRHGWVTIDEFPKLQDSAAESPVAQSLIEIVNTIPKLIANPRNIAAQRNGSYRRDLENAVGYNIVPKM